MNGCGSTPTASRSFARIAFANARDYIPRKGEELDLHRLNGTPVMVEIVLSLAAIGTLARLGLLSDRDRGNRAAIERAFVSFCRRAIAYAAEAQ